MTEEKIGSTYIREWCTENNIANLVIIHGIGEHSGRYVHVGDYFNACKINVYTGDLLGHGLSDGVRVHVDSAEDYFKDVNFFLSRIKNNKPTFILGHSMGGFIVLYYGIMEKNPKVTGLILSSPYVKERLEIPALKLALGRMVGRRIPKLRLKSGITGDMVCRDTEICKSYEADTLNCSSATAGWFVQVEAARKYLVEHVDQFKYPCLMMQAGADVIVDAEANKAFFDQIPVADKEFELYEGFFHEILNDREREKALERMYQWILKRI